MTPIRILIDHFAVEFGPSGLIFAPRSRHGRHLRFSFQPNPNPRYGGKLTPHVTVPGGQRRTLARIPPSSFTAFFDRVGKEIGEAWRSAMEPADLSTMALDGWVVALPSDADYRAWGERELRIGPRTYCWTERSSARLAEFCFDHLVPVTALNQDARRERQPFVAIRVASEDTLERCWLGYYPTMGWCRTAFDWLGNDRLTEILIRNSGPGLWRGVLKMFDLLQIRGDRERLHSALARVEHLQRHRE